MKKPRLLNHPLPALLSNLLLLYVLYALTRLVFVFSNWSLYADHLSSGYLGELMWAGVRFDTTAILYLNCWLLLAFLFPCHWKDERRKNAAPRTAGNGRKGFCCPSFYGLCHVLFVAINFIGLSANLCDCAYFSFTGRRTTGSVLQEFSHEGNLLGIVLRESLPYWYLFLLAALLTFVLWKGFCRPSLSFKQGTDGTKQTKKLSLPLLRGRAGVGGYYLAQTLSLLLAIPLTIGGMRGGFTTAVRPITISNANQYVRHSIDAGIVLNTPFSILRTLNKKPFPDVRYMTDDEARALYNPLHTPSSFKEEKVSPFSPETDSDDTSAETSTGQFRPLNVVVIILESFGKQVSARGFTPFLDSLAVQGRSFRYSYAAGRKSIDGMPSVLSAIPSFVEPFFLTPAALNRLSGLAGELSRHKGYTSAFFHGAENGSMGFQAFANATGFQRYYGRTEYNADARYHGDRDFDGTWAIWDEEFLQFFCDKMTELPEPFVTSVFTASSHSPFRLPERYEGQFSEGPTPLYACIRYSDNALRLFFEKARRQPWYERTLFVLTADHATAADDPEFMSDLGRYAVPVIFFSPALPELAGEDTERIVSQTDIMPTVLSLLRYDRPFIAFGQDVLTTPPAETCAANFLPGVDYYQFVQQDWFLQFDGKEVVHAYRFKDDPLLQHDLRGHHPDSLDRRLRSLVQQYMHRMNHDQMIYPDSNP